MDLVTAGEMQAMDRQTIESFGIPGIVLMETAGRGAFGVLERRFGELTGKRIGIMCGKGNNGGDGFVIARCLAQKQVPATVFLLGLKDTVKGDARSNLVLLEPLGVPVVELPDMNAWQAHQTLLNAQDIWVDAILGTGITSAVRGYFKEVIGFINASAKPVLAVDIPSGLDADSGQPLGISIYAHATATFGHAKIGHYNAPGPCYTGTVEVIDIGIPDHITNALGPTHHLVTQNTLATYLKPRRWDAHKGYNGHLLVVAGSTGKTGAAAMTAMAAARTGAGLVTLGVPQRLNSILEPMVVEAMTVELPETKDGALGKNALESILALIEGKQCLAMGPGMGMAKETQDLVTSLISRCPVPMVIDADGLNCLAKQTEVIASASAPVVLTPHPGELARLLDLAVAHIQKDRIAAARKAASRFNATVVLKGAATVTAHPDHHVFINPTGNPGMASGGMGDVLTGIIAGLITQGLPHHVAARAGVYLHGAAADHMAATRAPVGYLATEVMEAIPAQLHQLTTAVSGSGAVKPELK